MQINPVILLTHVTKPDRNIIANLCISKMRLLLPNIPIHLYSINMNEEDIAPIADYVKCLSIEEHYTGEIKSWDLALHELEEKGFNIILKSCSDCLWDDQLPIQFLNPVVSGDFDLVVSNTWLYFCGGPHCASTQIFCGTIDALKQTLPSKDRPIPWFTGAMEVNFRIGIERLGQGLRVRNIEDGTIYYKHGHTKEEFNL